jgi:Ion channel
LSTLIQLGAALAMVALCALVHAAGLSGISRLFHLEDAELKARKTAGTLGLVVVIALALFVLHLAEIGLFAALYAGVAAAPDFAGALYYSASAYTTAGNGIEDLGKGWRLLGATEALAGFLLIGWSVAYLVARLRRLRE